MLLSSTINSLVVSRDKIREQTSKSNIKKGLANKEENTIALLHKSMLHMNHEYYLQFWTLSQKGYGRTGRYSNFLAALAKSIKHVHFKQQSSRLGHFRKIKFLEGI